VRATNAAFPRKGIIGGWLRYATEHLRHKFKAVAGEALARLGYEADLDW